MFLFSVTIPAYKSTYLKEAIESVLAQTYATFELIIVNDHSPENLDAIVSQFNDSRIRYYVNDKNCGAVNVVDNWNICLKYAKGDYIICMGDDDKLLPCCLEEYNNLIELYPSLKIYHAYTEIINEKSCVMYQTQKRPVFERIYSFIFNRWTGNREQFIGDFLYEVNYLRELGGFYKLPLAWGSDDISAFRAVAISGIANGQVPMFQYRKNRQTISKTGNTEIKVYAVLDHERWLRSFIDNNLNNLTKEETIYASKVYNEMDHHFKKAHIRNISDDMFSRGFFVLFHWIPLLSTFRLKKIDTLLILKNYIKRYAKSCTTFLGKRSL